MPPAGRTGKWRLRGQLKSCPLTTAQVWLALRERGLGRMRPLALGAAVEDDAAGRGTAGKNDAARAGQAWSD